MDEDEEISSEETQDMCNADGSMTAAETEDDDSMDSDDSIEDEDNEPGEIEEEDIEDAQDSSPSLDSSTQNVLAQKRTCRVR